MSFPCHGGYGTITRQEVLRMRNEFTAVVEKDGEWYVAYCLDAPGANGQGKTVEECKRNLSEAVALILEDRREDGLRGVPADAQYEAITVE
jgi:predicted RNase H-like HicB family nuclease